LDIKEVLTNAIVKAAEQAMAEGVFRGESLPEIILEVPPQKEFGDFATNFAMQSARAFHTNPRKIAEALAERMQEPWLKRVEIAGPGLSIFICRKMSSMMRWQKSSRPAAIMAT